MSIEAKKLKLVNHLLQINNVEVLDQIQSFIDNQDAEIVGFTIAGDPLDKNAYISKVKESEKGIRISHEDIKKSVDKW